ncbi:MAG: inositol monophosphatase family protein [Planctomycetaceae bacterium]
MDVVSSQDLLEVAVRAAHAGGAVLQDWVGRFQFVSCRADLVTEADHASQQTIFELISGHFPDHGFLGEEGLDRQSSTSDYRWVIDPLDGTSNYVHGFPYYAVSIAVEKAGVLQAAVIFDPNRSETFAATRGGEQPSTDSPSLRAAKRSWLTAWRWPVCRWAQMAAIRLFSGF